MTLPLPRSYVNNSLRNEGGDGGGDENIIQK